MTDNKASGRIRGPLDGVRVLEMGQLIAGPFTCSRLADFGAEVIKIEPPGKGDAMRDWGHHRYKERGLFWPVLARNKRCITADLRRQEGKDLVLGLVEKSDVLVENFRPGTLEKWGMGPDDLQKINPRLIIVRVSGFGQTGPYSGRPGFASVGEAMGGLRHINGYPGEAPPRMGISFGDTLTSMFAIQGLLMALYWRDAQGGEKGQVVDASIMESCFALMESALPEYQKLGVVRQPSGTALQNVAPSNIYKTSDGKWVVIAANLDAVFRRLAMAMEQPELADDPKFANHISRGDNATELDAIVAGWVGDRSVAEVDAILDKHGVVCGPIYTIEDIAGDPHYKARDMILEFKDEVFGDIAIPGIVPKLSETAGQVRHLGRDKVGTDNHEVYGELLGITGEELSRLEREGVI